MKTWKTICKSNSKESGLMFIKGNKYSVEKYNGSLFYKYVKVIGEFKNSHGETFEVERIIDQETCKKYLKII